MTRNNFFSFYCWKLTFIMPTFIITITKTVIYFLFSSGLHVRSCSKFDVIRT